MSKYQFSIIFLIFLFLFPSPSKSEDEKSRLTVFCTNNKDGTGSCLTSSQDPVECILIPGSVVECNDAANNELICVSVHATSAIVEISCEKPKTEINANDANITNNPVEIDSKAVVNDQIESDDLESISKPVLTPSDQPNLGDNIGSPFTDPF